MTSPAGLPGPRIACSRRHAHHARQLRRSRHAALAPVAPAWPGPRGGRAPFERAARERKPVLLAIGASWCHGCAVMDRTTYSVPEIVSAINERCVPVRVDADRRPDINDRYNLDGWPTTAFLTPSGEVLTGSTYVVPDQMARMLDGGRRRAGSAVRRADGPRRRGRAGPARAPAAATVRARPVGARLADRADPGAARSGVRRVRRRRQVPARLARCAWRLRAYEITRDERLEALLTRTFDAMAWGGIFDEVDGGFFRYAAGREWTRPHTEKMLEDQAAMVGLLLDAVDRVRARELARAGARRDAVRAAHARRCAPAAASTPASAPTKTTTP